ncbi:hypothetical protein [Pseudonocardia sp. H11422]|uniref:hypothetical protein n=1 Tax=Pseudonocardia sp. H11422 TaxID=2835866 RepID=UPI003977844A
MAAAIGAANTLVLRGSGNGGALADNTDVVGVAESLREAGLQRVEHAVVLGAGGTAQAALAALRESGETAPTVMVRDTGRTAGDRRRTPPRAAAGSRCRDRRAPPRPPTRSPASGGRRGPS